MCASAALMIHGVIPAWCKKVGYHIILREADQIEERPDVPIKKHDE